MRATTGRWSLPRHRSPTNASSTWIPGPRKIASRRSIGRSQVVASGRHVGGCVSPQASVIRGRRGWRVLKSPATIRRSRVVTSPVAQVASARNWASRRARLPGGIGAWRWTDATVNGPSSSLSLAQATRGRSQGGLLGSSSACSSNARCEAITTPGGVPAVGHHRRDWNLAGRTSPIRSPSASWSRSTSGFHSPSASARRSRSGVRPCMFQEMTVRSTT